MAKNKIYRVHLTRSEMVQVNDLLEDYYSSLVDSGASESTKKRVGILLDKFFGKLYH